jgi:Raf kinase inhibitor-like YbhB/YbcL family protein
VQTQSDPRYTRRAVLLGTGVVGATLTTAGCLGQDGDSEGSPTDNGSPESASDGSSDQSSDGENPVTGEVSQQGDLRLSSPAFDDGEAIPEQYGYDQENVNPPLEIAGVPEGAPSLVLVVDDPDAVEPAGQVWDHWLVWNVPPDTETIPEGWEPEQAQQGTNDFDEVGYGGPSPPDEEHRYRFKCFALDTTLDLSQETDAEALGGAASGHVLAATQLDGTFAP